jgi:hypothetical protein
MFDPQKTAETVNAKGNTGKQENKNTLGDRSLSKVTGTIGIVVALATHRGTVTRKVMESLSGLKRTVRAKTATNVVHPKSWPMKNRQWLSCGAQPGS